MFRRRTPDTRSRLCRGRRRRTFARPRTSDKHRSGAAWGVGNPSLDTSRVGLDEIEDVPPCDTLARVTHVLERAAGAVTDDLAGPLFRGFSAPRTSRREERSGVTDTRSGARLTRHLPPPRRRVSPRARRGGFRSPPRAGAVPRASSRDRDRRSRGRTPVNVAHADAPPSTSSGLYRRAPSEVPFEKESGRSGHPTR